MGTKINPRPAKHAGKFDGERLAGGMGNLAAKQDDLSTLRRLVLANLLWENIAYADGVSVTDEISKLIPNCPAEAVAKLAVEARVEQKLRHIPLYLAVEMLKSKTHAPFVAEILPKIITRADMLTDILALYWKLNPAPKGKNHAPLSHPLKEGLAASFERFNEYQFAKYDRDGAVKLRDVMFLVRPKAPQGKEELYKRIADRELKVPDTWEVALSSGADKKATWTRLIEEGKIGGLAMLRNIANMKKASVDQKVIAKGIAELKSSMLLPLNFLAAARMNPEFSRHIEDAMILSYQSLPKLPGKTIFIVDVSGSMGSLTSGASDFSRLDHACAMAMLAANQCEDYRLVCTAGSDSMYTHKSAWVQYPEKGFGIFKIIKAAQLSLGGGGIFTRQVLEWAIAQFAFAGQWDRIIIFSDSQDTDRADRRLPKPFGKRNYICDVSSHNKGINYKGVWDCEITGFSERFITFIAAYEGIQNTFQDEEAN